MTDDAVQRLRHRVQWAHDHLPEHPGEEFTPEERAALTAARTAYASVLAMIDNLATGTADESTGAAGTPVLRLVRNTDDTHNRTGER